MGFDGIAAQSIMLIAVLGASALLVATFNSQLTNTANTVNVKQNALNQQIKSEITIEIVSYNTTSSQLQFYTRNTGKTQIIPSQLSFYVDSTWIQNDSNREVLIVNDTNTINSAVWDPKELIRTTVNITLSSTQTHTVKVITPYQASDSEEFTI